MKTILVLMVLLVSLQAQKVSADSILLTPSNVVRVYDGDTLTVNLAGLYPVFGHELGVRIIGIDTPELASSCATAELKAAEKRKAEQARDMVRTLVANGELVVLSELARDKYFRLLAKVEIDGVDVGETLIQKGLADRYDGGTKVSWCGR